MLSRSTPCTRSRGSFNSFDPLVWGRPDLCRLSIVSWNSNGLLAAETHKRRKKLAFLQHISRSADIICIQETHSKPHNANTLMHQFDKDFRCFHGWASDSSAGGVLIMLRRSTTHGALLHESSIVDSRIIRVRIELNGFSSTIWCVHNHGLSRRQLVTPTQLIREDAAAVAAAPSSVFAFVAGDWNFLAPNEARRSFLDPNGFHGHDPSSQRYRSWPFFKLVLGKGTDFATDAETHYSVSAGSVARLDRIYSFSPAWITAQIKTGATCGDPVRLTEKGISDHAPIQITFSRPGGRALPRVPRFIAGSAQYKFFINAFTQDVNLDSLDPITRWRTHKLMIVEASRRAAAEIASSNSGMPQSCTLATRLMAIARCVWNNNVTLFMRIRSRDPLADKCCTISDGKLFISHPIKFEKTIAAAKIDAYDFERKIANAAVTAARSKNLKAQAARRASRLQRLARSWAPWDRQHQITAIIDEHGSHIDDMVGMAQSLGSHWAEVFKCKPTCARSAANILTQHPTNIDLSNCPNITSRMIENTIARTRDSAPGPDGLPASCWRHAGAAAVTTLYELALETSSGTQLPLEFNNSLMVCIPKGDIDINNEIARRVGETRPLSLKNSDNKVIGAATARTIAPALAADITAAQRGFVPSRDLTTNIFALDAAQRAWHSEFNGNPIDKQDLLMQPATILFDFEAAFPSISHLGLFAALRAAGLPRGTLLTIEAMYTMVVTQLQADFTIPFFMIITSGVLQGCPLSGALFAIATNSAILMLIHSSLLGGPAEVRACADDIGITIPQLKRITALVEPFKRIEAAFGLRLKPRKGAIILSTARRPESRNIVKEWLSEAIPHWSEFKIGFTAKYLGIWLGPRASTENWLSQLATYKARCADIGSASPGAAIAAALYRTRAFPVLQYVAQLLNLPTTMGNTEAACLARVLKTPYQAWPRSAYFLLHKVGGPPIPSIFTTATAAQARYSHTHSYEIDAWYSQLISSSDLNGNYVRNRNGLLWPSDWDSPAIVSTLHKIRRQPPKHVPKQVAPHFNNIISQKPEDGTLQRFFNSQLTNYWHVIDWATFLKARARESLLTAPLINSDFAVLTQTLLKLNPHVVLCTVKFLTNAWLTDDRMQATAPHDCFWCGCSDPNQYHYLTCDEWSKDWKKICAEAKLTTWISISTSSDARRLASWATALYSTFNFVRAELHGTVRFRGAMPLRARDAAVRRLRAELIRFR